MTMKAVLLVFGALCLGAARAGESESSVVVLTPDNFDQLVTGAKHALVEFYAPWCGHCKRLEPIWNELADKVEADPKLRGRVLVAKVDADAHRELGNRFNVGGFPTINYFARGKPVASPEKYQGARSLDDFVKFLEDKLAADYAVRVSSLDGLAAKFARSDDKASLLQQTEEAVAALEGEAAENGAGYIRIMKKAIEKGAAWLDTEEKRLHGVIAKGKMSAGKLAEISKKLSILSAFKEEGVDTA